MPEQDLETREREIAEAIYHQINEVLYLCDASNVSPFFTVTIGEIQYNAEISSQVNSYGNRYIQISLDITPHYIETENKYPLAFFVFENKYFFGIGQMEEIENGKALRFAEIDDVRTILQAMNRNLPYINEAVLNLFQEVSMQIYDQRLGSAFWEDTGIFLEESNVAAKIHSLIESSNALLKLKPEKHNYLITPNEQYLDSETEVITKIQSIELYRLPESNGGDLVIEIELLQSGTIRTDIVFRLYEEGNKFKVWMTNTFDAETCAEAKSITLEQAQMNLTESVLQYLNPILSRHNLPETEDGIVTLLQKILSDELHRIEIEERIEAASFELGEDISGIFGKYCQREIEKPKSLIRQYDLILQDMDKGNSSYNFYQWKICCAYAELDYLRSWYEFAKNRAEFKSARKDYLSAVEIADTLAEKKEIVNIVNRWQKESGIEPLRKAYYDNRNFLRRLREV